MKLFLFFTSLISVLLSDAQNLVPNPSFEEFTDCPFSTSELENLCEDWVSWSESPDYLNVCNNEISGIVGVPNNTLGFQNALSGQAYSSLATYGFTEPNSREYMAVELNQELIAGEEYYVMFFASLYDGGEQSNFHCATNHIGLRFFENPTFDNDINPLVPDNFAHLDYTDILFDDQNWVKIDGWVTAGEAYNWLAIGNFFTDENTDIEILDEGNECFGFYYIENVCVSQNQEDCDQLLNTMITNDRSDFAVYPNPTKGIFNIKSDDILIKAVLTDLTGKMVWSKQFQLQNEVEMSISNLAQGIYHLKIQTEKGFYTHRILKQ